MKKISSILLIFCMLVGLLVTNNYYAKQSEVLAYDVSSEATTRGGGGDLCSEHVKNIKQTKTYNCGPTTILQSLYALESEGQVAGSTDAEKIATLEIECQTSSQGGTYVYKMVNALNKYNVHGSVYQSKLGSSFTLFNFKNTIAACLTACRPVVLHARTQYLSYYNGNSYGHYLSLDSYDRRVEKVRIVDCNYKEEYYGIHTVPVEEAYNCVSASGRYLIY